MYLANRDPKKRLVPIYEFMPLYGDPTEEELKEMEAEKVKKDIEEIERIKSFYRERGLLN